MTIPTYIVTAHTLSIFASAAEAGLSAEEYLILSAVSLADNGEKVQLGHIMLLTGLTQPGSISLIKKLKNDGQLEQLGASYYLTSRSKKILKEIQQPER